MIPKECKRLAEVDFPIAVVSKHSAREKSIRHGHPSTLHLWWARRPLAACRAMLMALLLPDPEDQHCPAEFKATARSLLGKMTGKIGAKDTDLRAALLRFIGDFADWDNSSNGTYLEVARGLVKAAHPEETPLVVDPFAGGGSIPLEALRLGCDAFASDLNPVACLINKVLLEDIPRHGPELAEEYTLAREQVIAAVRSELAEVFPSEADGSTSIVYLWAKTVRCEAPECGAEIPLVKSFWLSQTKKRCRALRPIIAVAVDIEADKRLVEFEVFTPSSPSEVRTASVNQARATCFYCNRVLAPERVRAQLREQHGGVSTIFDDRGNRVGGAKLLAVVTILPKGEGRAFRSPSKSDYTAISRANFLLRQLEATSQVGKLDIVPKEPTPVDGTGSVGGGYRTRKYGVTSFGGFFNQRQLYTLATLARIIAQAKVSDACKRLLSCALSIFVRACNGNARLRPDSSVAPAFGMQSLPITWTFPETVPWGRRTEHFDGASANVEDILRNGHLAPASAGQVQIADALASPLAQDSAQIWFTDPPYYDSIPYADLSDFSYVWLKRVLPPTSLSHDPFDSRNPLTPKNREAVRDQQKHIDNRPFKTSQWYEQVMHGAFKEGFRVLDDNGIGSVVFAHKTTEGWEALLTGLIAGGWTITGSWPIATESAVRLRARESAALATSVHLVCRPRSEDAPVGDWGQVLRELPKRVAGWIERLQAEGVRGADLVFACIGPALEIFSRYSKVVDAEEREIPLGGNPESREPHLRGFLAYVWEVVGRSALEQVLGTAESKACNGAAGALEEDARLTALFLWTLQATTQDAEPTSNTGEEDEDDESDDEGDDDAPTNKKQKKGISLPFDVARRFAQPLGIHLDAWEGRCIETEKGIVRLIPVLDRAEQLFGQDGAEVVADRLEKHRSGPVQLSLFAGLDEPPPPKLKGRKRKGGAEVSDESLRKHRGATTLDHVHAAMLLQSSGRANALRALLKSEIERGPDFLRLANALSALYPKDSDEKRLLDAMLLAVPR